MKRSTKIWLIAAGALIALGLIVFAVVMALSKWDFTKLSDVTLETNTYEISESFTDINIDCEVADISVMPSEDGACRVVCSEDEDAKHSVSVKDGVLTVTAAQEKAWHENIHLIGSSTKITVCLPEAELNTVKICSTTGGITVKGIKADELKLSATTGSITLSDSSCGSLSVCNETGGITIKDVKSASLVSKGSTGSTVLKNVIVGGKAEIERSTGDIELYRCDAESLDLETDTGDITATLLSGKDFDADSSTGDVSVPDGSSGGKCRVRTGTGSIDIKLVQ